MFGLKVTAVLGILFVLNAVVLKKFATFAKQHGILIDIPNWRSNHSRPTVRGSGIVFVWSALVSWICLHFLGGSNYLPRMIVGGILIASISFWDDLRHVKVWKRLAVQTLGSVFFLSSVPSPDILNEFLGPFSWVWWPVATFFMIGLINLYNFMDGIDGLCASHSLVVLLSWIVISASVSTGSLEALICLCLAVPLFAFLIQNWKPARTFMGDVGSTFLGYTLACLAVVQVPGLPRSTNFFALIMLMMPFLFDATFTLIVRFAKGEKWYLPHSSHIFQRLVRAGYSHAVVSFVYMCMTLYAAMVLFGLRNFWFEGYALGLPLFTLPYFGLYLWLSYAEGKILPPSTYQPLKFQMVRVSPHNSGLQEARLGSDNMQKSTFSLENQP